MKDGISNESAMKIRRVFGFIGRFSMIYLVLLLYSNFIYYYSFIFSEGPNYSFVITPYHITLSAAVVFLMYYSLQRTVSVYNTATAKKFIYTEPRLKGLKSKLKFLFTQKEKLLELGLLYLFYLVIPTHTTSPSVWSVIYAESGFLRSLYVTLITLGILTLLFVLANISAMNYWDTAERYKEADKNNLNENQKKKAAKLDKKTYRGSYIALLLAYFVGGVALMMMFPFFFSGAGSAFTFVFIRILSFVAAVLLSLWVLRILRSLIKRRRFISRLKKLCKEKKMRISKIKYGYRSLFTLYNSEDFRITYNQKTYSCKLLSSMKRGNPLFIMKNGIGAKIVNVKFMKIQLFSYTKSFKFGWEADCKKLIIVNPTPLQILVPGGNRPVELDNGDIVDGYEIYVATGFLNALERDIIDDDRGVTDIH